MQQDQEYLQRARARLEDETLQALDGLELAEAELGVRSKRLAEVHQAWERAQSELAGQVQVLRSKVAELKSQRSSLAAGIDAASMKMYEEILRKKGDRAVALLVGQTCQGCRVTLPTGKAQEARKSATLALCSNCGRILVAE